MRRAFLTTASAAAAAVGLAAVPAHAAAVDRPFAMAYGNSRTSGSIRFTSGCTASPGGVVHAAGGRRAICADGCNGSAEAGVGCSDWAPAGGPDAVLNTSFGIDLPGGVQRVVVYMLGEHGETVASEYCTRSGCIRTL